jgi:hypothetical protein
MAQYIQKQCEKAGWMNLHECSDPSAIGVVIKIADRQYAREPTTIDPILLKAFQCMDAAIAFTMTSVVTAAIFRQVTPNQKELTVKARGTALPIVDTFHDLISSISMHGLTGTAYLLRKPQLVVVWSNSVEDILMCGATIDELLCQAVSFDTHFQRRPTNYSRSQIKIHLLLSSTMLVLKERLVFHPGTHPDGVQLWRSQPSRLLHHLQYISGLPQKNGRKPTIFPISNLRQ